MRGGAACLPLRRAMFRRLSIAPARFAGPRKLLADLYVQPRVAMQVLGHARFSAAADGTVVRQQKGHLPKPGSGL
ncbi:hypothetical protein Nm8I071_49530 [Nonomuraea sp. TT08I-71]|nr:hypothetical protein Nm8I071_49530 [Nonomuraea sp. TT08I-71]